MSTCVLLAGGLGTRLRAALPRLPKCLAPVGGRSFLEIQMESLASQGIEHFVLALGYRAEQVVEVAKTLRKSFSLEWVVEPRPLGTGGGALLAMYVCALPEAVVANADTFFQGDLGPLLSPLDPGAGERIRMAVAPASDGRRFGSVVTRGAKVEQILPGGSPGRGLVNAGIYRVHLSAFDGCRPGQPLSLEADVAARLAGQGGVSAVVIDGSFVDIGVPQDYFLFCAGFDDSRAGVSG